MASKPHSARLICNIETFQQKIKIKSHLLYGSIFYLSGAFGQFLQSAEGLIYDHESWGRHVGGVQSKHINYCYSVFSLSLKVQRMGQESRSPQVCNTNMEVWFGSMKFHIWARHSDPISFNVNYSREECLREKAHPGCIC